MKKRKLKLSLNKEVISNLQAKSIIGGVAETGPLGPTIHRSREWCNSWEANCNSIVDGCDCGTSGNCETHNCD